MDQNPSRRKALKGTDQCAFAPFARARVVDGGVTATGVLSRERGNLITISITLY